ncbi:MAG: IS4 family transposase DNA-binding protein, partial [Myxococcales bacterium]
MRQADTSWKLGFAASALGDVRRAKRFHKMLAALSRRPSGKVSEVFRRAADQQAAYD